MPEKIKWGILGCGGIAHKFANGLKSIEDAELIAAGSRTKEKAGQFAQEFDIPHAHGSYEDLANDADVDAIYVATPHPMHMENSILCLRAGKAVLCEKPFTLNAEQAKEVVRVAREQRVFLMEAMWSRFLPTLQKTKELIDSGEIGDVLMVQADFGFRADVNPDSRLFNLELGGGALLDIGIYPISFASFVFGRQPEQIVSLAHIGETGADEQDAMVFGYGEGKYALIAAAIRTTTSQEATVFGTDGRIRLHPSFWKGSRISVAKSGQEERIIEDSKIGNGYNYEAAEVGRCLREGLLESPVMSLDETIQILETLDKLRAQWGLKYPAE